MRFIFFVLIFSFALLGTVVYAHGPGEFGSVEGGSGMMRYIEDQALGAERHEAMETLMGKMMAGKLSEGEAAEIGQFMQDEPGVFGMMMNRMGTAQFGGGMMGMGGMMGSGGALAVGWGGLYWGYWITVVLLWVFLGFGIYALWVWIGREKR